MYTFLQVTPYFRDLYNSRDIGLFNVSVLDVGSNFVCYPEEVHSKCVILPGAIKPGTKYEPDLTHLDPLPSEVKAAVNSKTPNNASIFEAYSRAFPLGVPSWTVHSLLRPAY